MNERPTERPRVKHIWAYSLRRSKRMRYGNIKRGRALQTGPKVWENVMKWSIHEQMECKKGKYGKCRGKCENWVNALLSLTECVFLITSPALAPALYLSFSMSLYGKIAKWRPNMIRERDTTAFILLLKIHFIFFYFLRFGCCRCRWCCCCRSLFFCRSRKTHISNINSRNPHVHIETFQIQCRLNMHQNILL